MSDNIKVVVKVRPLIPREIEDNLFYQWRVENDTLYQIDQNERPVGPSFTFDKVYDKHTKTSDVYKDVAKPIVEAATAGFNGTIFAYGQTSSGKTFTMTGSDESPGIIQLAVLDLFEIIQNIPNRDFLVRVSYVEIYNETLTDLLCMEKKVKIHDTIHGFKVDTTEEVTSSPEEILDVMRKGKANRQTAATNMNEESSRSHSIFQITIESREHIEHEKDSGCVHVSQLNLVDLAGSERAGQTGATGLRFKEGTAINKSLSSLALVIKQLSEDPNKHVNYRDSKLTRILQNSLGGNAKTSIICAVTPAAIEETISTLQFANRAKAIKNKPAVNAVATDATMIQKLTKQLSFLKTELESKKNVEKYNNDLQKKIGSLQRLILNGFGRRNTADILNPRRKLVQPRRITISTLQSIQEDPAPDIPKFCTPSLKYNPLVLPGVPDFQPLSSATSLPALHEEPPRERTPPRAPPAPFAPNEVIDLDSDDDCTPEPQTCPTSPYHNCFESSKTPPCILKRTARRAEKNLKDIVELTGREKLFEPSVVELMEKLEHNATVVLNLEDEINKLNIKSKEKDFEMEKLKSKLCKFEDEMKMLILAKVDLESRCKEYNTKLTDSEVSYETLKKKAKSREAELLSLLEEQVPKKPEIIGQLSTEENTSDKLTNLSVAERKISNDERETSNPANTEEIDLQGQLTIKDAKILELEEIIAKYLQEIVSLEKISEENQYKLNSFSENITRVEDELLQYKATVDNLNKIIEGQKENIEIFKAEIESYKTQLHEQQNKFQKEELLNINISERELEDLITSEETFLANNENMNNLIKSFKLVLVSKNNEIKILRTELEKYDTHTDANMKLESDLSNKNNEIANLTEEIQNLKSQLVDKGNTISKIGLEQNNLEKSVIHLTNQNEQLLIQSTELKALNEKLGEEILNKDQEFALVSGNYSKQIEDQALKIESLENELLAKNNTIISLERAQQKTQEHFNEAKSALCKIQSIMEILTGNIKNVPDVIDNFVIFYKTLCHDLSTLESIAQEIKSQKMQFIDLIKKIQNQYAMLEREIDMTIDTLNNYENISDVGQERFAMKGEQSVLNNVDLIPNIKMEENINLRNSAFEKLHLKVENILKMLQTKQPLYLETIKAKDCEIADLKVNVSNSKIEIESKDKELLLLQQEIDKEVQKRDQLLINILNISTDLTSKLDMDNNISLELKNIPDEVYERIIYMLNKTSEHMEMLYSKIENNDLALMLLKAKKEIQELTEINRKYMEDISHMETTNYNLSGELDKIRQENSVLAKDLNESSKVLDTLQQELKTKLNELENIQDKAREWKTQFINLDFIMKEQMHALHIDNENLQKRSSELVNKNREQRDMVNCSNVNVPLLSSESDNDFKSPQSLLTLCCNIIIDSIQPNDKPTSISASSVRSNTPIHESNIQRRPCRCDKLELKLKEMFEEKKYLKSTIEKLKISNKVLKKEHSVVQEEVKSLLDVTYELHKRVINHRTNLSTLTAMTFAENKSLSSQNKFLQHHHHRLHHLCQRDIPAFKQQLQELMMLLKSESRMPKDSLKRFSTTNFLCNTSQLSNIKDESALDADLLMLDTNVTLTTTGDTTLVNHDQTCFDVTQICAGSEVACQTADFGTVIDPILFNSQIYENPNINYRYMETLDELRTENSKLRDMVNDYYATKKSNESKFVCTSPTKNENLQKQEIELLSKKLTDLESEKACILDKYTNILKDSASTDTLEKRLKTLEKQYSDELIKHETIREKYLQEIEQLTLKLSDVESEKDSILDKYNNLMLEIPSTDMLVKKLTTSEKEYNSELEKLKTLLKNKNEKIADLQEENDSLSTQVMETISEVDDLKKVQEDLKAHKAELTEKCLHLQIELETVKSKYHNSKSFSCPDCKSKDELISSLKLKISTESHSILSRSYSDSDRTSRYNTICTLQSELHAGKEDCNTLKEEVTTIKNHLYRSNLSMDQPMDLDDSMGEPNLFNYAKDCNMPSIAEKRPLDTYAVDKAECFNYYVEITGANKEDICNDIKIIDIMKMLYDNVVVKHGNEVENLINKLRDCADCKTQLELQIGNITKEYSCKTKELDEKTRELETIEKLTFHIKYQISQILNNSTNLDDIVSFFRETILKPLDTQFDLNSSLICDSIISKLVSNLNEKTIQCSKLEDDIRNIQGMLTDVKNNLTDLTSQLTQKENEYNLLAKENERIQEICKALTLDIVKKEQELDKIITEGCRKLSHHDILEQGDINSISPVAKNIDSVFDLIIKQFTIKNRSNVDEQNYNLIQEVTNMKTAMAVKHVELQTLTESLQGKESELQIQKSLFDDLNKIYEKKVDENSTNIAIINKMNEEINALKETLQSKEVEMKSLQDNNLGVEKHNGSLEDKTKELIHMKEHLEQELGNLKAINDKISKENDTYATHLEKSSNTIKSNKIELEALISEVDKLKETVKQNLTVIEKLKEEVKCLFEENTQLKEQLQEKVNDCSRLEINIKTHEKTSEIQSRMIKRLQKQKEIDDEKDKQMEELKRSYSELEKERDALILDMKASAEELQHLNNAKQLLQAQVSELQDARRPRLSLDALGEGSRRRRQSIHDSNRMFAEDRNIDDRSRMEGSIGSRSKNDVSLMDVDDVDSNRSTPLRLSKGRDSSQGKLYQSDREEEAVSRPSSVQAARRRRQSVYDLHRSTLSQSPSPHDHPRKLLPDLEKSEALPVESELSEMRKQLASCQDELEELREKYKELDDECETCAQYLRERDEQCLRLKREKQVLEQEIADLKVQLPSCLNKSGQRNNFSDAAVNTDEDWANLHSVVVDRMSYNAEVEKNKKLTKTIEELRFHKQDLKATMAKMQNALDKRSGHDNRVLEMTKSELHSCKQELGELKELYKGLEERYKELEERYKELDEECETCAEYLRERDEQCRKLKEAKIALEARLADHEADASAVTQTVRKKRQTLHDQNRDSTTADLVDASTETNEDLQTYQVEKDTSNSKPDEAKIKEIKRLKYLVEKLMQQKAALEQQLAMAGAAHGPLLVASGSAIVQNQQLTDLMKENQKLKKINTKLIQICKKRNKTLSENRENQDPSDMHD